MQYPVYFISDIHLTLNSSREEQARRQKLFRFLDHVAENGGTLFLMGDLFDFYFEYRHLIPKAYFDFYNALYQVKNSGVEIHYLLGNHDYWVRDFITRTLTSRTYFEDTTVELGGKIFFLTHGDGYLSWDTGYQAVRRVIRSRIFITLYRWLHPNLGYRFANWISKKGRHYEHSEAYNRQVLEEMKIQAEIKTRAGFDYFITGHYHQAREEAVDGGKLLILGDWVSYFSYGYFDGRELSLQFWEGDEDS